MLVNEYDLTIFFYCPNARVLVTSDQLPRVSFVTGDKEKKQGFIRMI